MKDLKFDVALSFAGEDRLYVEQVAKLLRDRGIKVFYDDFNKVDLWGKNLIDHLASVYAQESRFIIMFISKYYAEKTWTNHERKFAQERAFKLQEDCILPVRFDDTEIPGLPSTISYIDLRNTNEEELVELIEEKINLGEFGNDYENEDLSEDESEILYSERVSVKPNTHIAYICDLDAGDVIQYEVDSKRQINVMLMDEEDYESWIDNETEEYTFYEEFKEQLSLEESFSAPEAGKYRVVVVNYASDKTKVQVNINLLKH